MNIKLTSLGLAALLLTTACSDDRTELINTGHEITFHTSVSRAANLTTGNLLDFQVWAYSGVSTTPFINGEIASRPNTSANSFNLSYPIYWPSEFNSLDFWAFAPSPKNNGYSVTLDEDNKKVSISGFTPAIAKQESGENGVLATKDQLDLIIAGRSAARSEVTNGIALTFNHALSQIVINAQRGSTDEGHHNVKIKGAWIVNAYGKGDLTISNVIDDNDKVKDNYTFDWTALNTPTIYGSEFNTAVELTGTDPHALLSTAAKTDLLLLPHNKVNVSKWDPTPKDAAEDRTNTTGKAYILILCRVEAVHSGALHNGATDASVKTEGDNHLHQLFPVTTAWNDDEYGYTCVPIDINWEPGKRYEYNLTFCGSNSGAGIYPPDGSITNSTANLPNKTNYIIGPASGKKGGDPVLDNPISFTVTVSDWVEAKDNGWTGGNVNM